MSAVSHEDDGRTGPTGIQEENPQETDQVWVQASLFVSEPELRRCRDTSLRTEGRPLTGQFVAPTDPQMERHVVERVFDMDKAIVDQELLVTPLAIENFDLSSQILLYSRY